MWLGAKPRSYALSKCGSQCAIGQAQLSLHSCHDFPSHTHTLLSSHPLLGLAQSIENWGWGRWRAENQGFLVMLECSAVQGKLFVLRVPTREQLRRNCDQGEIKTWHMPRSHLRKRRWGEGLVYLSLIFLLLLFQCQLYEHLLQLLIAVVDHKLLKAIVLRKGTQIRENSSAQDTSFLLALPPFSHILFEPIHL